MEQFIECKCLRTRKGLIPFWQLNVMHNDEDDCIMYQDPDTLKWEEFYDKKNSITAIYDLLNKTVIGEKKSIKVYEDSRLNAKVGDRLLTEVDNNPKELQLLEVIEVSIGELERVHYITEEEFKSMGYQYHEIIEEKEISNLGSLIKVEVYSKEYTFSNGSSTEYTYNLYKLKE